MPDDDAEREQVRRFLSEAGVTFPNHLVDERAYDQLEALARGLGRPGMVLPTVFVVDKQGRVRRRLQRGRGRAPAGGVERFLSHPSPAHAAVADLPATLER